LKITPYNILNHELIGLNVELTGCKNKSLEGVKGMVIDETMKTFLILTSEGSKKRVPKDVCSFIFTLPNGTRVKVDGSLLVARPEDRVKRLIKRRW